MTTRVGGRQGGRVEGRDRSMVEGRPLPALHVGGRTQGSSSGDVELVAIWNHLEDLPVEKVLIDLLLGLHTPRV